MYVCPPYRNRVHLEPMPGNMRILTKGSYVWDRRGRVDGDSGRRSELGLLPERPRQ